MTILYALLLLLVTMLATTITSLYDLTIWLFTSQAHIDIVCFRLIRLQFNQMQNLPCGILHNPVMSCQSDNMYSLVSVF